MRSVAGVAEGLACERRLREQSHSRFAETLSMGAVQLRTGPEMRAGSLDVRTRCRPTDSDGRPKVLSCSLRALTLSEAWLQMAAIHQIQ